MDRVDVLLIEDEKLDCTMVQILCVVCLLVFYKDNQAEKFFVHKVYITSFHWLIHALSRISHIQRMAIGCTFLPTRYREALTAEAEVSQVIRNSYLAQNLMQITRSLGSSGVLSRRSCLHTEATDM